MAITTITRIINRSKSPVSLHNIENPNTSGSGEIVLPNASVEASMFVPWATNSEEFKGKRLELRYNGQTRFWLWQALGIGGDLVRFSLNGTWQNPGFRAHGMADVGGNRTLVVEDDGFELQDLPAELVTMLGGLLNTSTGYRMSWQSGDRGNIASVPRHTATGFSVAAPTSDAFLQEIPESRFRFNDSGKRYRFTIRSGVVVAIDEDGRETELRQAISYSSKRSGIAFPAPFFDMVAANGGRVFAKERNTDRFFFTTMDEMFIHARADGQEIAVPSNFFKIDPEFNQSGADRAALVHHLEGFFADHPAAERFPLFRLLLEQNLFDMMIVRMQPRVWHQVDVRPPIGIFNPAMLAYELLRNIGSTNPGIQALMPLIELLGQQYAAEDARDRRPPVAHYQHAVYTRGAETVPAYSIDFRRVLDIGVGHVHVHEQYERVTGGEIQPLRTGRVLPEPLPYVDYASLYRFANGPVQDGDGFIDGTCNFYVLAQLSDGRYELLYADEQLYFTQRWRLAHHSDYKGLSIALAKGLLENPEHYQWNPTNHWSPFQTGHIGPNSRMAVSRQVVLVTGTEPSTGEWRIYSTNYSYSSMDRTWRWRRLPPGVAAALLPQASLADEVVPDAANRVYPQTIRLREDMTMHLKGTTVGPDGSIVKGRFVQRYLPAGNELVPPASELGPSQPGRGFSHPWRFVTESVFQAADFFSHFGVYDTVDSRTQYYSVEPASTADAQVVRDGQADPAPWIDEASATFVYGLRFSWSAPLYLRLLEANSLEPPKKVPPSLLNRETRLKLVERDSRWIAMHWDKRDDELVPFQLPVTLTLRKGFRRARVTLTANRWVEQPPSVSKVEAIHTSDPASPLRLILTRPRNVFRLRIAALDQLPDAANPNRKPNVVQLLDLHYSGRFVGLDGDRWEYRWTPTSTERARLGQYFSPQAAMEKGTSVWFEDAFGHVSVPDSTAWLSQMKVSITPQAIPLGLPISMTIRAVDSATGQAVAGAVLINGIAAGPANTAFNATVSYRMERVFDPELGRWLNEPRPPSIGVTASGYVDEALSDVEFYEPSLRLWVEPGSLPLGRPVQFTVRAVDSRTGSIVSGRVKINGVDVGGANTAFGYTFGSATVAGTVSATGYPETRIRWPSFYTPSLSVNVTPTPVPLSTATSVTVRTVEAQTGAVVSGRVLIDGVDVAPTNTPFTYIFRVRRVGRIPNIEFVYPSGLVRCPGFPDLSIDFGFG